MDVVVVESPTKARSIARYLGEGYEVLPSYGHVRDLPEKDGSVRPENDFEMIYEPLPEKKKRIEEIARAVRRAKRLWLATDPDREGEAISWHLVAALAEKGVLKGKEVKRVVFHEITKKAVLEAMKHPRDLDEHLIDAYQARRALDYLVGFTLSPVLWRKLQGSRSAGRVQSVALRLICEREAEIESFVPQEYWTVEAELATRRGETFRARLFALDGRRLGKFDLPDEAAAKAALQRVEEADLAVLSVERRKVVRNPAPPFTTATLQQEAARKLGFSADRTMRVAQRLFEGVDLGGETVGLITYMRTDSVQLSGEAIAATRELVGARFGPDYLPEKPRQYRTKAKNAQEAHEAIRPTDPKRDPESVARFLDEDQRRLYELIWRRTVASQMAAAILDRVTVDIGDEQAGVVLRATGQTIAFDGFLRVYQEGRDEPPAEDEEAGGLLPRLESGEGIARRSVEAKQHFTEPPPRYTEASLVKKLEELGIGRPSTYASIISVLQDRKYVRLENRRFVPEDRGRLVNAFLTNFFDRWVQPEFTAKLEAQLDAIAAGEIDWRQVLRRFWEPFHETVEEVRERRVAEIIDALNEALAPKLFPPREDGSDPRACPACGEGRLSLKFGRYGAFVGCSRYPECRYTRRFGESAGEAEQAQQKDRLLGVDPENDEEVWLRFGRFGPYVQRGTGDAAVRSSLPPGTDPDTLDLARALQLLALPRTLGTDPETGEPVEAGINRYGPYVRRGRTFVRLPPDEDVLTIGMNRALTLLAEGAGRGRAKRGGGVLRDLGAHPETGEPVQLLEGRFGPYVRHGKVNASLRKGEDPETLTLDQAVERLAAKAGAAGNGRRKSAGRGRRKTEGADDTAPAKPARTRRRGQG
jgi:DNA topoisomerase-1